MYFGDWITNQQYVLFKFCIKHIISFFTAKIRILIDRGNRYKLYFTWWLMVDIWHHLREWCHFFLPASNCLLITFQTCSKLICSYFIQVWRRWWKKKQTRKACFLINFITIQIRFIFNLIIIRSSIRSLFLFKFSILAVATIEKQGADRGFYFNQIAFYFEPLKYRLSRISHH